jgi:AraC family transcriptional regulator
MPDETRTLGFGVTFDTVAVETACGRMLSLSAHRDNDANPPHRHVNDYVCIVLAGGFAERWRNCWRDRRSGSYFVHRAGELHHDRFGSRGAICLNLHLAPGEPGPRHVEGRFSAPARVAADRLACELATSSREELVMAAFAAEIMAEIGPTAGHPDDSGTWIDKVVQAISDEPARRWSLRELAGIAGRHPVHVAQAFRARTGISLGAFQRIRRLLRLGLALRHGTSPLTTLACEFGYCDQPHMNAEFRAAFGMSPGRYRRSFH